MKRYIALLLAVVMLVGIVPVSAQEAPEGTWLGTWPYVLPPEHDLGSFTASGLAANLGNVYRSLVEMPFAFYMWSSGEYEPMLASEWGFTEDNTAYRVTINADAMWSDGSPVTSADVLATYSIGRIRGWSQYNYISEVRAIDDKTVEFVFSGEPSLVAERLILKEYIVAAANYGELAARADEIVAAGLTRDSEEWAALASDIGAFKPDVLLASGPYTYTLDTVNDAFMTMQWQPNSIFSGSVQFGEIKLWAGETEVTTPLVLSGELAHSTNVYPANTVTSFESAGINLVTIPRAYGPALLFQHDTYPFNIVEVRQAMAYAINRDENAFLTNGIGASGTVYMSGILDDMVTLLLDEETVESLNRYEYNLETAAGLMETAGFTLDDEGKWVDAEGNRISVEYKFPAEFADFSGASQNAIDQLNAFGFDITARANPWQEVAADIRAGNFQLSVWSWAQGSPFATSQFFGPIQRFNYVGLTDGQIGMNFQMEFEYNGEMVNLQDMINNASTGLDVEAQRERAGDVATIINDLMPFIPLNVMLSVEPMNEAAIAGVPDDSDPIWLNPSGVDHPIIWLILQGTLSDAQ
ncbi:MAG: ABC transporter substrate-binding protein [Anaerolineae bacterium]|jgi:peptide/nickel transport system substrate-binding protein|nr:ABC transporter substrate-binding protein [Anaerolineae bacterium]